MDTEEELNKQKILEAVKEVEDALIAGDYQKIGTEGRPSSLSASEIETAVTNFRPEGKITESPELPYLEPTPVKTADSTWFVSYGVWFDGQQSELTMPLSVIEKDGEYTALVDGVRAL